MPAGSRQKTGVLLSGGLDSAALLAHLATKGVEIRPIFIQCGLRWERAEIYGAKKFLRALHSPRVHPLKILKLDLKEAYRRNWSTTGGVPGYRSADESVFLPARNLLLMVRSLLYLSSVGVDRLALATLKGNPFPDGRASYFRRLEGIFREGFRRRIRILAPFRKKDKRQVIKLAGGFPIHLSFSCINPKGTYHCGRCNKCAERKRAFRRAGVEDKTVYRHPGESRGPGLKPS